ncbi:MAG: hypothetical protein OEW19_05480 [Acidobacteriota bacterium]|nr:hypothetical protein [Acidobacteriota bacterium]
MAEMPQPSVFRVEKLRSHATLTLATGEVVAGCFFLSPSSAHLPGPERVGELLNEGARFFPFELHGDGAERTVMLNRAQVLIVTLAENEARQVPGYDLAVPYLVSIGLAHGPRLMGTIRVYGREGSRLSDWTHERERFRYVEDDRATLLVNMAHVVDVSEVPR